jgi:rod shape determining protein RodA
MLRSRLWKNFDWLLLAVALALVAIGLLVIYATSFKATTFTAPTDVWHQMVFLALGLTGMVLLARADYRLWRGLTPWLYGLMIFFLALVLVISHPVLGATRWINLGFFQFQPSEFAKLVLIIVLARFFADNYDQLDQPKYLALSLAYLVVPVALVMKQPDLGTALVLVAIWLSMALVSRVRKLYLLILAGLALISLPFIIKSLKPFQRARLDSFLNPTADPLHTGYNAVQSTITVGSGQLFGRGLAAGTQTQLGFLPTLAQHTDFIFAALAEKMGFVGAALLLGLFIVLLLRGLQIGAKAQDRFGLFLATGIVAMFLFHIFINVGMNMGIAPVTGIPLPFVSYGGTSLLVALGAIGLLESIAMRHKKIEFGS